MAEMERGRVGGEKEKKRKTKQKWEKSAGGSTRGLRCQLDTAQTGKGWARDIHGQRRSGRAKEWEEVNERDERKLKKNDWGNITGLEEQGRSGGG